MTITTTVPAYGGTVPDRVQSQVDFNNNVQDSLDYWLTVSGPINDVATEMNALSVTVNGYADDAEQSAIEAEASAELASATVNASPYVNTTTYNYPDNVIGSDGQTYRCVGTSVLGDDPVGSVTGNWVQITTAPLSGLITFNGLFFGGF